MSRHRLYQNYDFQSELDDNGGMQYLDEEGEDELSPEDKVQMDEGTADIKRALGPRAVDVTTKQIQDALWHYYYDVDKSVAYLLNKFIDPAPKPVSKPKPTQNITPSSDGMQPSACPLSIDLLWPIGVSEADHSTTREPTTRPPSMSDFFADMPWQNIPEHRRTVFVKPPRPRGGLLGGSSATPKSSKLAALAAARKRKVEEATLVMLPKKEENNPADPPRSETSHGQSFKNCEHASQIQKVKRSKANSSAEDGVRKQELRAQDHHKQDTHAEDTNPGSKTREDSSTTSLMGFQTDGAPHTGSKSCMAKPSAFAQVLCYKSASETPRPSRVYYPPWMAFTTPEVLREAFEKPSPDDVVLAAQSQGSRFSGESRA